MTLVGVFCCGRKKKIWGDRVIIFSFRKRKKVQSKRKTCVLQGNLCCAVVRSSCIYFIFHCLCLKNSLKTQIGRAFDTVDHQSSDI